MYALIIAFKHSSTPIHHIVRISREDLLSHIQTGCLLILDPKDIEIDLTEPKSPKIGMTNIQMMRKLFYFKR